VIVPLSLREAHRTGFSRYMTTGESRILDRRIEITALRADGSEFPVELTITRTGLPGSPAFIGYCWTARKCQWETARSASDGRTNVSVTWVTPA